MFCYSVLSHKELGEDKKLRKLLSHAPVGPGSPVSPGGSAIGYVRLYVNQSCNQVIPRVS